MSDSKISNVTTAAAPAPSGGQEQFVDTLKEWAHGLLASNPLYFASAGFLLYGINRLSSDPRLAGAENSQLVFNFCALFGYEILLVITAIVLARRSIWYDALLLVSLENLFVLIPFSLVSRAVLLNQHLAWVMCAAAMVLGVIKFLVLKRYIPELNLSRRWLVFGVLVMAANVGIALGFQRLEQDRAALLNLLRISWLFVFPLVASLTCLLPKQSAPVPGRRWFSQAMFGIWLAVTGCHLGGVGYVYDFNWRLPLLAPTLWILAWIFRHRISDLSTTGRRSLQRQWLCAPLLVTILAVADDRLFPALNVLNVLAYGLVYIRDRKDRLGLWFALFSLTAALAGMPADWARQILPHFSRGLWASYCLGACLISLTAISRDPRLALLGGAGTFIATRSLAGQSQAAWGLAVEITCVFVILHSLRWHDEQHRGSRLLRIIVVLVWMAHSFWWIQTGGWAIVVSVSLASLVLVMYCVRRLIAGGWPPWIVPGGAMAVLAAWPANQLMEKVRGTSAGHLSVGAGFVLFALGTWLALTKPKWKRAAKSLPP